MSPLALRRSVYEVRRPAFGVLLAVVVAVGILNHHTWIPGGDHGDHHGVTAAVEMCLGVFTAIGAAVAVVCGLLRVTRRRAPAALLASGVVSLPTARSAPARAGPPALSALCVWRR